ncbi:hypothetical protein M378DRAFT_168224, partial [Amanita muscaria Koide BX008]
MTLLQPLHPTIPHSSRRNIPTSDSVIWKGDEGLQHVVSLAMQRLTLKGLLISQRAGLFMD